MNLTNFLKFPIHFILVSLFYFFMFTSCNGQINTNKNDAELKEDSRLSLFNNSVNRPDIHVKVNKRYDEQGNIIKYDSSYTYVYKGGHKDLPLDNDSLFKQFKTYFNKQSLNQLGIHGDDVFFSDSLFQYDFFNDDYFQKRFELNQSLFSDFFRQLDSLKKDYLREYYSQSLKNSK